jgi:hypothetical protein
MLPWWVYPAALCFLCGATWGYMLGHSAGYMHRDLIEWGRRCGRLLAWQRKHRRRSWRGVWR